MKHFVSIHTPNSTDVNLLTRFRIDVAHRRPDSIRATEWIVWTGGNREPRFLVDESAKSIATQLGATVNEKDVRAVAQK